MDIILGIDWMTKYKVLLDISSRVIEIDSPYNGATTLYLPNKSTSTLVFMQPQTSN
jgi:hypothetical protein